MLNGGLGVTHLNKVLSALNMTHLNYKTFCEYQREVGIAIEDLARDSCKRAALEERELTIKNSEELKKLL